jgi:hypothetical protein
VEPDLANPARPRWLGFSTCLIRLRAYAFGNGRSQLEVATEVVDRRLRFDDDRCLDDATS